MAIVTGTSGIDSLTGTTAADTITGFEADDTLLGLDGNDVLDGGPGVDSMVGGKGNDVYYVDDAGDLIFEDSITGSGTDTVFSTALSYTLSANIERLTLLGTDSNNGTGNDGNNILT